MTASAALNAGQERQVELLAEAIRPFLQVTDSRAAADLRLFCQHSTYVRFLAARSWNLQKALKLLKETIEWRASYRPFDIKWDDIYQEALTGKQFIMHCKDKEGRTIVLLRPRNENTKDHVKQIKYLVYTLEAACRAADESGIGKMTWLIDFEGYSLSNAPPFKISRLALHILQNHYPERLGKSVSYHAPWIFSVTWKACSPFIDPVTYKKITFVGKAPVKAHSTLPSMDALFDMAYLEQCMGGEASSEDVFSLEEYALRMRAMDAAREEELSQQLMPP